MRKIAVIGSNNVDLITYVERLPENGETLDAPNFDIGFGGKGANQAVAAAKLGANVMMLTVVGDDLFGPNTRKNLEDMGVDTRFVRVEPNTASGVAPIFVFPDSSNRILIVKGANLALNKTDIEAASAALKKCCLIVLQLEIDLQTVYAAIEFGKANGIPVLLNPAPATKLLDMDYVRQVDFFTPNETELEILTNMPVSTIAEITSAGQHLVAQGVKNVIVTMGGRGSLWITRDKVDHIPCLSVNAVDTSGAGDAYMGAFAHYYAAQKPIDEALLLASKYASFSTCAPGTQKSYLTAEAFAKRLRETE